MQVTKKKARYSEPLYREHRFSMNHFWEILTSGRACLLHKGMSELLFAAGAQEEIEFLGDIILRYLQISASIRLVEREYLLMDVIRILGHHSIIPGGDVNLHHVPQLP